MSGPVQPAPAPGKAPRRHPSRHHQPYRRASAVIDDRPNGKAVIFGYGKHLTNREKERLQRLIAYVVLGVIVAVSVAIIAVTAVYQTWVYPNQSVASVNGVGITRHDRDLMTGYFNGESTLQGTTLSQDPGTLAVEQLQKSLLARQAAKTIGIAVSDAQADAQLTKDIGKNGQTQFQQVLTATGLSRPDYVRFVEKPDLLRTKVMAYLTRGASKTAEEWHYARIEVSTPVTKTTVITGTYSIKPTTTITGTATRILNDLVTKDVNFGAIAKKLSADTATKANGGDVGWVRTTDTAIDSQITTFLPTLKTMASTHTKYKAMPSGKSWYILELLGHDLKHPKTAVQTQNDQTIAYTAFYNKFQAKSVINPPLPAGLGIG
jgi:parvulin-like peptidyl-prolyl isomerase